MSEPDGHMPCLGELNAGDEAASTRQARETRAPACDFAESKVWDALGGGWECLYGCYCQLGISVEWHDFTCQEPVDWSRTFHPESLELCLNISGRARMECGDEFVALGPRVMGFYSIEDDSLKAWRLPGERHQFLTIEFSRAFLECHLKSHIQSVHPVLRRMLKRKESACWASAVNRLDAGWLERVHLLRKPPVAGAARGVWYQGQALALMAEVLFDENEKVPPAGTRKSRVARQRVNRVKQVLAERMADPISLEDLGREVGCSPHYLSRVFSAEMGITIQQYRRQIRMERAAKLLESGKFNVTEAALEVGYSSLSHFSHAFCEVVGCCPGLYPLGLSLPGAGSASPRKRGALTNKRQ